MKQEAPSTELPAQPVAEPVAAGPCVLLVDDNDELRGVLAAMLSEEGIASVQAGGAAAAAAAFGTRAFDAAVIDLVMPGVHGLDLLAELRATADGGGLPAVVLSALSPGGTRDAARATVSAMARTEFLDKPVTARRLLVSLGRLLVAR